MVDPTSAFRQVLETNGLRPGELIADGKLHRCPTEAKPNGKAGAYILHSDDPMSGFWQNWQAGTSGTWTAKDNSDMTPAEREKLKARIEADKRARQEETARHHAEAREKAARILAESPDCQTDHPYLAAKGVSAHPGLKLGRDGVILVPVFGPGGKVMSLQRIWPDGSKRFLTGGQTSGGFFAIRGADGPLFVAEGYATAATVHAATGHTTLAAFNAGNLKAVAQGAREVYPKRTIIICADDDAKTEGNPGITKAREAARAVGGIMVAPRFSDPGHSGTDFNDLAAAEGLEAVKALLAGPMPAVVNDDPMNEPPLWLDDVPPPDDQAAPAGPPGGESAEPVEQGFLASLALADYVAGRLISGQPPALEWTFQDSLLTKTTAILCGPPGVGKSTLLIHLAAMVATGGRLFGDAIRPGVTGKVLALFCEEDSRVLWHRVHRIGSTLDPSGNGSRFDTDAFLVPASGKDMRLVELGPNGNAQPSQVFRELLALAKGIEGLALIILDPLSRLYGQNENDNTAATMFCTLLGQLAEESGASVLLCHHVSKGAATEKGEFKLEKALSPESMRGASALTGAVRWQMNLVPLPEKAAQSLLRNPEARGGEYMAAQVCKKNHGAPEQPFFLRRVEGGLLELVEVEKSENELRVEHEVLTWVLAKVKAQNEQKLPGLTAKMLSELSLEWKAIAGCSKTKVRDAVTQAVTSGQMRVYQKKNRNGKMTDYLYVGEALPGHLDEPAEEGKYRPAALAGIEPAEPARTGQRARPVVAMNEYNMLQTGQKNTGQKKVKSPPVPGPLEPAEPAEPAPLKGGRVAPLGGHLTPSTLGPADLLPPGGQDQEKDPAAITRPDEVTI